MKKIILIISFIFIFINSKAITVSGYVKDFNTNESLIGVVVKCFDINKGVVTNNYGFFSLQINQLPCKLVFSYIGYQNDTVNVKDNDPLIIKLKTNNKLIKEVVVKSQSATERPTMGTLQIPISQIKMLPTLGGEVDVLKTYQLMPGVQSGSEGTSGLYVRGGSPDQNLVILDDIPLYYVSHIGGFISIFDANAINSVKLIKGGFPAHYGGRLSSVVDIRMKQGNKNKIKSEIGIGAISSKLFIEGPIDSAGKTTFMLSARRCNLDLFSRGLSKIRNGTSFGSGFTFYDLYGKITHQINKKNSVSLSIYSGRDKVFINQKDKEDFTGEYTFTGNQFVKWGNQLASLKFNHQFSQKLYSSTSIAGTQFYYAVLQKYTQKEKATNEVVRRGESSFSSGVKDILVSQNFDYFMNSKHQLKFGLNAISHQFNPGVTKNEINDNITQQDTTYGNTKISSSEFSVYAEDEIDINEKLNANIGLHFNGYKIGSDFIKSLQPRLVLNYKLKTDLSLKASYSLMNQNLHLLSNNGAGLPADLWVPATAKAKPEKSQQVSAGLFYNDVKNGLEFSIETYFKTFNNLIEFSEGASFFAGTNNWDEKIQTNGKGKTYGIELLIQKKVGKITGWIGYTFSYNLRKFDSINSNKWFPYKYDRRHYLTAVANYQLKKNVYLSADFVYSTGNAITLPDSKYQTLNFLHAPNFDQGNLPVFQTQLDNTYHYPGRNQARVPDTHHLDIAVHFTKEKKRGEREWVISIYNIYARQNPYYLYFDYDNERKIHLYQFSLLPFIPSVAYIRKF